MQIDIQAAPKAGASSWCDSAGPRTACTRTGRAPPSSPPPPPLPTSSSHASSLSSSSQCQLSLPPQFESIALVMFKSFVTTQDSNIDIELFTFQDFLI